MQARKANHVSVVNRESVWADATPAEVQIRRDPNDLDIR
jgi:hypothetical protein